MIYKTEVAALCTGVIEESALAFTMEDVWVFSPWFILAIIISELSF